MTTAAAGPDDLAPALAELEADGRAYVLEYLAGAARANLEVRLALARALAAEARTAPLRRLEAGLELELEPWQRSRVAAILEGRP